VVSSYLVGGAFLIIAIVIIFFKVRAWREQRRYVGDFWRRGGW
jgi:hypothetical protein